MARHALLLDLLRSAGAGDPLATTGWPMSQPKASSSRLARGAAEASSFSTSRQLRSLTSGPHSGRSTSACSAQRRPRLNLPLNRPAGEREIRDQPHAWVAMVGNELPLDAARQQAVLVLSRDERREAMTLRRPLRLGDLRAGRLEQPIWRTLPCPHQLVESAAASPRSASPGRPVQLVEIDPIGAQTAAGSPRRIA